jgi:hypothetical protein
LEDDLLLGRERAASDRKLECALQGWSNCAAARLVEQALRAASLQLEFLPLARLERAELREQLARLLALLQQVLLVSLRQLERVPAAQQLA